MNLSLSPDDGRTFVLAIGLGTIVGIIFGGWVMAALHKLLMAVVRFALLGAVVVVGGILWNGYQSSRLPSSVPVLPLYPTLTESTQQYPTQFSPHQRPAAATAPGRWWEQ